MADATLVNVFTHDGQGGNPAPIVLDAQGMADDEMQAVAREHNLESGFVLPPDPGSDADYRFRFFVPEREMEMCGHATIGALWLLAKTGAISETETRIDTQSGRVLGYAEGTLDAPRISITQPKGHVADLELLGRHWDDILAALKVPPRDLARLPIQNAFTSRVKTLVPLRDAEALNAIEPDFPRLNALCTRINSTGLYPYAVVSDVRQLYEARQFPYKSGYPEDAATGIAATALAFGMLENGMIRDPKRPITVYQGRAMGRLSEIRVIFTFADGDAGEIDGCLLSGDVSEGA
jgi:PhzF family phenazine biosynthesis protein